MKIVIYALMIILALSIQTTLFTSWSFLVVTPDLILVLVVLFSLINGPVFGAKFGFFSGLAVDLFIGELIGLNALTKMIIGIMAGLFALRFFKENYVIPFISVIMATLLDQILYSLGMLAFGVAVPLSAIFEQITLPLILYNGILSLLLYVRLYYFNKKIIYWDELVKRAG